MDRESIAVYAGLGGRSHCYQMDSHCYQMDKETITCKYTKWLYHVIVLANWSLVTDGSEFVWGTQKPKSFLTDEERSHWWKMDKTIGRWAKRSLLTSAQSGHCLADGQRGHCWKINRGHWWHVDKESISGWWTMGSFLAYGQRGHWQQTDRVHWW